MKAIIEAIPIGTPMVAMSDGAVEVKINGYPLAILICGHQAEWMCRWLNRAREESSKHQAMNILTETLGFCDDRAEQIYNTLKMDSPSNPVPKDILDEFSGGGLPN